MIRRVLVADDHESWFGHIRAIVESRQGWSIVAEVSNGVEAVEQARLLKPDLVILDVDLPVLTGIAAARRILADNPKTKILFFSAHLSADIVDAARRAGGHAYLSKLGAPQLLAAMDAVIEGKPFMTDT